MADFIVATPTISIFDDQQQQNVAFILEPDTVCQEPPETFQIEASVSNSQIRPLATNEFLRLTKRVTIIDRTSKQQ